MTALLNLKAPCRILVVLLCAVFPLCLKAHPHNWITLKSEFIIDEKGLLTELHQYWEFDVYFSMMTLDDVMHESRVQPNSLQLLATDMVNNMQSYRYFSQLQIDNRAVALAKPTDYALSTVSHDGQQQLLLYMRFQLPNPQQITDKTLIWQVYDPTYFIDMKHNDISQVIMRMENDKQCSTAIEQPKPSDDLLDYALSLDQSEKNTQGLGAAFAEKVIIQCANKA